jgi:hypothetical protein
VRKSYGTNCVSDMTLADYADVLRTINDTDPPFFEGDYKNDFGVAGYRAYYHVGNNWFWYSVSDTTAIVLPSKVVEAIEKGRVDRAGIFKENGFEATIRFENQSYMLNMGSKRPQFRTTHAR